MERYICSYCHCPNTSKTIQYIVCNNCANCIDRTYETDFYDPQFEEVSKYSHPLLDDDNRSISTIERLIHWSKRDIKYDSKRIMIIQTTILKNKLKSNNITFPSEYYLAASIVFSKRYGMEANIPLEHLSYDFNSLHEQMLKKALNITHDLYDTSKNKHSCPDLKAPSEINKGTPNYITKYINDYWDKKIIQVDKIKTAKNKSVVKILKNTKISKSSYYRAKNRLNGKFTSKKRARKISEQIGVQITELRTMGHTSRKIQELIAIETRVNLNQRTISRFLQGS